MPVQACRCKSGKSGHRWGDHGTCYCGPGSAKRAGKQGAAAYANGFHEGDAMATACKAGKYDLQEAVYADAPRKVDREAGVIKDVKVLGRKSQHGYTYADQALTKAGQLYEGIGVCINHPPKDNLDQPRGIQDTFGYLTNPRVELQGDPEKQGVYADLVYVKSHALAEQICEMAERMPKQFGLSHNAHGPVEENKGEWQVGDLEFVRSVDVVRRPATNRGLYEGGAPMVQPAATNTKPATTKKTGWFFGARKPAASKPLAEDDTVIPGAVEEPMAEEDYEIGVDDAFGAVVMAIKDSDVDAGTKASLIQQVLELEEQVKAAIDGKPAEETEEEAPGEDDGKGNPGTEGNAARKGKPGNKPLAEGGAKPAKPAASAAPAVDSALLARVERMERKELAEGLLAEYGIAQQPRLMKLLEGCGDEAAMRGLIECWPSTATEPSRPRSKSLTEQAGAQQPKINWDDTKQLADILSGKN